MDFENSVLQKVFYMDSLTEEHSTCRACADQLLSLLSPGAVLPERFNYARQPVGSAACGFFVLSYMTSFSADFRGSGMASSGWPGYMAKAWKNRLSVLTKVLSAESIKCKEDAALAAAKAEKTAAKAALSAAKSKAASSASAACASSSQVVAAELLDEGHAFALSDLSAEALAALADVEMRGLGICSRCRWTAGCLSCNLEKARAYWLAKEKPKAKVSI